MTAAPEVRQWFTPEVEVKREWYYDEYTGSKAALVAARIVPPDWFPGEPGRNKVSQTFERSEAGDQRRPSCISDAFGRVRVTKRGKDRFDVMIVLSEEERERRRAREDAALARSKAEKEVSALPASRAEFRRRLAYRFKCYFDIMRTYAEMGQAGYRFSADALGDFDEACAEMVATIVEADVDYSPAERAAEISSIRARAAKEDRDFEGFMATTMRSK